MSDDARAVVAVAAHAKVNLYLAVGKVRDDGYHEIVTVLAPIALADEVIVETGVAEDSMVCDTDVGSDPRENLAWRAVEAYRDSVGETGNVAVTLRKRIPIGAGLGGGSADAAAVLLGLDALAGIEVEPATRASIDYPHLLQPAASLGSDVPFFLGEGPRLMIGRGDEPRSVMRTPAPLHLVVVKPADSISTSEAYRAMEAVDDGDAPGPEGLLALLRVGDEISIARSLFNNMTSVAASLVPETSEAIRFLEEREGVLGAALCGSGSAVFGICSSPEGARGAADAAQSEYGWWACATHTVSRGTEIVEAPGQ